jgi:hypothetical protein
MMIEATFRATADGVILARGGQSLGFLLEVANGKPVFAYRGPEELVRIVGSESIVGKWVTLKASIDKDRRMRLEMDGKEVGQARAKSFINRNPNDGMQIGADTDSPVDRKGISNFQGQLDRVRIYQGTP